MFKQATVEDVSNRRITRLHGRIVAVTHYYPRYLQKKLIDEYHKSLAPTRQLLEEFKAAEERLGDHDRGFEEIDYESKFWLSEEGFAELQRLSIEAESKTVYLVCHCSVGQRCHREVLMVLASTLYQAPIGKLSFSWEKFRARLLERAP